MKALRIVVLAGALVAIGTVGAADRDGSGVSEHEGGSRVEIRVPGRLVSYALPQAGNGRRTIALLVAPQPAQAPDAQASKPLWQLAPPCPDVVAPRAPEPMRLFRADALQGPALELLRDDLPADLTAVEAVDLDGDGSDELLLARDGALLRFPELTPLVTDPDLVWHALHPRAVRVPGLDRRPIVAVAGVGRLRAFGPGETADAWDLRAEIDLPLRARLREQGLQLESAIPEPIGIRPDGTLLFGTAPERVGSQRLHTRLSEIDPAGQLTSVDCWARLPAAEDLLESRFLQLDGQPVLYATTKPAGKLSLFGEKGLRLYALERDRSRLGLAPLLATESRMNLWQASHPSLLDVNRDGRTDLVVGYWKGLTDTIVVLDVYLRAGDGAFAPAARSTSFDVKDGDREFLRFGEDLDGDGRPDLLLRAAGGLELHRGLASNDGRRLVDPEPRRLALGTGPSEEDRTTLTITTEGSRISLPASDLGPWLVDLDGDGRVELLSARTAGGEDRDGLVVLRP